MNRRLLTAAVLGGGLLAWWQRSLGAPPHSDGANNEYWLNYLSQADAAEWSDTVETVELSWQDIHLTADVYPGEARRPTILFIPGTLYARPFAALLLDLKRRGLTVVALDLAGTGRSEGPRGAYTVFDYLENIRAATDYAAERFGQPVYLFGVGLGGSLSYYAAADDSRIAGLIAYNVLEFTNPAMLREVVRLGGAMNILAPTVEWAAAWLPMVRVPAWLVLNPQRVIESEHWREVVSRDPLRLKGYSLNMLQSMLSTRPNTPFERFRKPALVIAPEYDDLFPVEMVRRAYNQLAGPKELWIIAGRSHLTFDRAFLINVAARVADWVYAQSRGN